MINTTFHAMSYAFELLLSLFLTLHYTGGALSLRGAIKIVKYYCLKIFEHFITLIQVTKLLIRETSK